MEKEDKIRLQKAIEKSLGEQWEVKPITVPKVNGPRDGLRCRHEGDKHALVIYPDDYAGMLASGESMADIGRYAAGLVEEKRTALPGNHGPAIRGGLPERTVHPVGECGCKQGTPGKCSI